MTRRNCFQLFLLIYSTPKKIVFGSLGQAKTPAVFRAVSIQVSCTATSLSHIDGAVCVKVAAAPVKMFLDACTWLREFMDTLSSCFGRGLQGWLKIYFSKDKKRNGTPIFWPCIKVQYFRVTFFQVVPMRGRYQNSGALPSGWILPYGFWMACYLLDIWHVASWESWQFALFSS